jgi:hypothetical protein
MKLVIVFLACLICIHLYACNKNDEMTNSSNTSLGRIDNSSGLATALGSGNTMVKVELE